MTLPLARELGPLGIRVMCIAPGVFNTAMMQRAPEPVKKMLVDHACFPKRLGYPNEFARLAKSIIENPYLNGECIRLDAAIRMPKL